MKIQNLPPEGRQRLKKFFYLELSHHRWIIFLIFSLSSLEFESAAEISETLELKNPLQFSVIHL